MGVRRKTHALGDRVEKYKWKNKEKEAEYKQHMFRAKIFVVMGIAYLLMGIYILTEIW